MGFVTEDREEARRLWIEALESGKYKQAYSRLSVDGKYCCLGVACAVLDPDRTTAWEDTDPSLPNTLMDLLGLCDDSGTADDGKRNCLVDLNDDEELPFKKIAKLLREGHYWKAEDENG